MQGRSGVFQNTPHYRSNDRPFLYEIHPPAVDSSWLPNLDQEWKNYFKEAAETIAAEMVP